jgi:hypothetical protein
MRPWAPLVLLGLLVLAPAAAAQEEAFTIPAGAYRAFAVDAGEGSRYDVSFTSDVPLDVLLVNGTDDEYTAGRGGSQRIVELLNRTSGEASGAFPSVGRWTLIIDNSAAPEGGANGTQNATVAADVEFLHVLPDDGTVTPTPISPEGGSRNPWPVLMLTSPSWDLGVLGLGGMALWFLILAALAAPGYRAGWDKVGVLAVGAGLLIAVWSLLPARGPIVQIGLPLLVAAAVAWLATRPTQDGLQRLRMAFLGAGFGAILGVALGHLLRLLWSDPGMLLIGADRFDDPVFVLPVAAGAMAFVVSVIEAFVAASEEEPAAAPGATPGITATFTVTCLRCHTPITVDRSMKRYRVATDRYEFACPNCHAWMEWAEPKPEGAAAA